MSMADGFINADINVANVDEVSSPTQVHCFNDASVSIAGDETPPRRITEVVEPGSLGMPPSSSWEPRLINRKNRSGIPFPRSKSNGSTRSRNEESVTSSVFSVASGLVAVGRTRKEDLEGLIVQTTPSQDDLDGDDSSLPTIHVHPREKSQIGQLQTLLSDLKHHLDRTMIELRDQSRRDFEKVLAILQQESAKRTDLEQRLHSQLLLQSETMVAMELKLLRLEAKVERREAAIRQQRRAPSVSILEETAAELGIRRPLARPGTGPSNIAVITSGASLASGVTAGSFLVDGEDSTDKNSDADGDVEDEGEDEGDTQLGDANNDESHSTPTQGSRHRPPFSGDTLDSILLNPMVGESSMLSTSIRATRGETDGNSSLATSVTNSTITSTVVTATTRGDSVNIRSNRFVQDPEVAVDVAETPTRRVHSIARGDVSFGIPLPDEPRLPRSRSQSPLTVQSSTIASEAISMASASIGTSILTTAAVAPSRSFGTRRAAAAAAGVSSHMEYRPIANRVVSFTTDILNQTNQFSEAGDSITMPDELDNLSDIADAFAASARSWREEYEARLDALQKRWATE